MPTDPARRPLGVRFDQPIWADAIRGFSGQALDTALTARRALERDGVALGQLIACESLGPDHTELSGCAKLYLPIGEGSPSRRPFAFVFQLARDRTGDLVFVFVAFGLRHPGRGIRNVYERAHRQLHGKFPDRR